MAVVISAVTPPEPRFHDHTEVRPGAEFVTPHTPEQYANGSNSNVRAHAGVARGIGTAFDASTPIINRAA